MLATQKSIRTEMNGKKIEKEYDKRKRKGGGARREKKSFERNEISFFLRFACFFVLFLRFLSLFFLLLLLPPPSNLLLFFIYSKGCVASACQHSCSEVSRAPNLWSSRMRNTHIHTPIDIPVSSIHRTCKWEHPSGVRTTSLRIYYFLSRKSILRMYE